MRKLSKKWTIGVAGLAVAVAGGAAVTIPAVAQAADGSAQTSIVEDYSYPGAAQILADENVKLISGDGHIVLADCSTPPNDPITFIYVYTSDLSVNGGDPVCFRVLATPGVLKLEVPSVFEIRGDGRVAGSGAGHDVTAVIQPQGGTATTVQVDSDGSTPVGIGADPNAAPTTLLQLTAKG